MQGEPAVEDVDDDDTAPPATDEESLAVAQQVAMTRTRRTAQEQALVEMTQFTPAEFSAMMIVTFGEEPFQAGYSILKSNRTLLFEYGSDDKINELLKDTIADDKVRDDFIKRCSAYMIVQGIKM